MDISSSNNISRCVIRTYQKHKKTLSVSQTPRFQACLFFSMCVALCVGCCLASRSVVLKRRRKEGPTSSKEKEWRGSIVRPRGLTALLRPCCDACARLTTSRGEGESTGEERGPLTPHRPGKGVTGQGHVRRAPSWSPARDEDEAAQDPCAGLGHAMLPGWRRRPTRKRWRRRRA